MSRSDPPASVGGDGSDEVEVPPARPTGRRSGRATFGPDVLKLASGAALGQLISVLVAPVLARLYAPEDFGVAALFIAITGIINIVGCFRYEMSIALPERDEEAANLLGASLLFVPVVTIFTFLVVFPGRTVVLRFLKAPELGRVLWLMPIMVFASGVFLALSYWNARTRRFGRLSLARVSSSAATSAAQIGAGVAGHATGPSLVGATVFGTMVATTVLGGQILRDDGRQLRQSIRWTAIQEGLRRHRKFPLFGTFSSLLNATSWQLPAFMLQSFFSSSIVGFYAFGNRILRLPMSLIGSAIGQVFFQHAAEARREGTLDATVESAFRRLVAVGIIPAIATGIVGREAFALIFGGRWAEAGLYAQILAPWTFFWFLSSPLSTLFSVLEKQEFGLKLDAVIFSSRFASLAIGGILHDARLAIGLFSASGVLVYGYYTFAILAASGANLPKMFRFLLGRVLEFVPAIAILVGLKIAEIKPAVVVGVTAAIMAAYAIRTIRNDPAVMNFWRSLLAR